MKIILRTDVDNLGRLGDQVNVKPGFARNYLIPQGMAMAASTANLKQFELERKKLEAKLEAIRNEAASLADKIAAAELVIEVRVGEGDKLYGSVTTAMIADALAEKGLDIDKRKILLDEAIRSLGEYVIPVKLHADVVGELKLAVIRKGGSVEELHEAEEAPAEAEAPAETEAPEAE